MDIDVGALRRRPQKAVVKKECGPRDGSFLAPTMEVRRLSERKKPGLRIRDALGVNGRKYVIDMGEYRRKKVKVYVRCEERTVAVTVPEKWVDEPVSRLAGALSSKARRGGSSILAARDDRSYCVFARRLLVDELIGDLKENDDLFLMTQEDVSKMEAEINAMREAFDDYERQGKAARTLSDDDVAQLATTTSLKGENDGLHVLLVGMKQMYILPVEPTYTVADVKSFIHLKGGPDVFPWPSLDVATIDNLDINVLDDRLTMADLRKKKHQRNNDDDDDGDLDLGDSLVPEHDDEITAGKGPQGKKGDVIPLFWGKRLQDPKFFFWIPSLHTADSFRGLNDDDPHGTNAA